MLGRLKASLSYPKPKLDKWLDFRDRNADEKPQLETEIWKLSAHVYEK